MKAAGLILDAHDLVKTFPGVRALDGVRFELRRGEVHALVGENGAGKSTLIHLLAGILQPNSGDILIDGAAVQLKNAHEAAQRGIGVVFQELSLVPNLSVAENVYANRQPVARWGLIDRRRLHADTRAILTRFELGISPQTLVKHLSMARQQLVEILKALSLKPRILVLDEPTSSLTSVETRLLFDNLRRLKSEGVSCIYVSHHLPEIFEIADRVTVLRDGRNVETCLVSEVTEEDLVRKMVGRELANLYGERTTEIGEPFFEVERARRVDAFEGISLSLRRGEIVGLAGLVGAGRTELGRALFGAEPIESGRIVLNGQPVSIRSPRDAIAHRVGYLTEDRKAQGLFLRMTVRDNCGAPSLRRHTNRSGLVNERALTRFAETCAARFDIITPTVRQRVMNLSGGNQQKVLLSMWVGIQPEVLIVDEPTRGVDVGARSQIYSRLRELSATGVGILLISSDLTEILGLCDRVLVLRQGRLAGEFTRDEATEENVIACASGVALNCFASSTNEHD